MRAHMPVALINLVSGSEWKGSPLLDLSQSGGIKTPTAREISVNYCFIKPVVKFLPHKVQGFLKGLLFERVWCLNQVLNPQA